MAVGSTESCMNLLWLQKLKQTTFVINSINAENLISVVEVLVSSH